MELKKIPLQGLLLHGIPLKGLELGITYTRILIKDYICKD